MTATVRTSWNGPDTINLGPISFTVIERRGNVRVGYAPREPLPYVVVSGDRLIARIDSRVLATTILGHLEEK